MREGADVEVTVDSLAGTACRARVALVSPVVDPQAGTVTVKAILANPDMRMKPGMFARVKVLGGRERRVTVIPASAIARRNGDTARVFAVVDGRLFLKEAALGPETRGGWIVERGLAGGDRCGQPVHAAQRGGGG